MLYEFMNEHVMVFSGNAETLNKGFTIVIDNRHGNLTTSVKKLLSAAEVGVSVQSANAVSPCLLLVIIASA